MPLKHVPKINNTNKLFCIQMSLISVSDRFIYDRIVIKCGGKTFPKFASLAENV